MVTFINHKCTKLNIFYQNVRGLRTKTETVLTNTLKQEADVILLTETWLNDSIFDYELLDSRYTIFRRDRSSSSSTKTEGGGVLVAILKKHLPVRKLKWESTGEDLWIVVKVKKGNSTVPLCICTLYNPPPVTYSSLDSMVTNLTEVIQHKIPKNSLLLLVGDFNLPNLHWQFDSNLKSLLPYGTSNQTDSLLTDALAFNSLHQLNKICNANGRLLDLIITNTTESFTASRCPTPLVNEDIHHPALQISLNLRVQKPPKVNSSTNFNFYKANYSKIEEELGAIDWSYHFKPNQTVDEIVDTFYDLITPIITSNTPITRKSSNGYPFWFSRSLLKTLREKAKYHLRYKKYLNPRDLLTYQMLRSRCDNMMQECLNRFKSDSKSLIKKDPKYFWTFLKSRRSNSAEIPDEMFFKNETAQGGQKISNLFSKYFSSIYPTEQGSTSIICPESENCLRSLGSVYISVSDILKALQSININKGPGPDSIPPIFIKKCSTKLVTPLHYIFNKSLTCGIFPTKWKNAYVTPIYKKDDQNDVMNYRPISILSSMGKLFESMVQKIIYYHLKPLLDSHQHGFLPGRSTSSNLIGYVSDILETMEDKSEVHAIYTDFSKAFDVVDHCLLVEKLGHAGICGSLLRWCESYLRNRSQLVKIRGFKSTTRTIPSGVPQGSHLGPLFFLIFINDLCSNITSNYEMFADDLKLYRVIRSREDTLFLQNDIDTISNWCIDNKMLLNISKCYHIKFTRKLNPLPATYYINNIAISEVFSMRDLGVIVDTKLDFREHVDTIAKKGARLAGFVLRQTKFFKDYDIPIILFNCIVRSLLEYCSPVWSPSYAVHIQRLEKLQKQFLYHLTYANNLCHYLRSYVSRLNHFNMVTLEQRRNIADIVFLRKLIIGRIDSPHLLQKVNLLVPRSSSRLQNRRTFQLPSCRTNYGQHSPMYRMCSSYNKVCKDLDVFNDSTVSIKLFLSKRFQNC